MRLNKYTSIFGENWVVGRYLLPELESIGKQQYGIMLDLACGESPFRCYFPNVEAYLRIDLEPNDSEVMKGNMLNIPCADNSVDVILISQAITDVPHPVDVLKEVKRVLRQGGVILIFESMSYPEHDAPYDYYRIMPEGIGILAAEAGLTLVGCKRLGGLFTRFSSLWNNFLMGGLKRYLLLKPLASLGILFGNMVFYSLDRFASHPRLASDYLAILRVGGK